MNMVLQFREIDMIHLYSVIQGSQMEFKLLLGLCMGYAWAD